MYSSSDVAERFYTWTTFKHTNTCLPTYWAAQKGRECKHFLLYTNQPIEKGYTKEEWKKWMFLKPSPAQLVNLAIGREGLATQDN